MKKIFAVISMILVLTMLPLSLFSCNVAEETEAPAAPTETPTEAPTDTSTEKPEETAPPKKTWNPADYPEAVLDFSKPADVARVKRIGRTVTTNKIGIGCDLTATGIEFSGTMVGDVTVDVKCTAKDDNEAYLTVLVDGVRVEEDTYVNGKRSKGAFYVKVGTGKDPVTTLTVASFDEPGEHTITILKQTESNYSLLDFRKVTINGSFSETAPANRDLYIEFVGDSLTCAMGSAGNTSIKGGASAQGINGADWEDGTLGYAYLTAQALNADWSIISESGIGLSWSWFGTKMPDFYLKTSFRRFSTTEYDFKRVPDFIVINLGTNDHYLREEAAHKSHYTESEIVRKDTEAFIRSIREKYNAEVPIVWVSGVWDINSGVTMQEVYKALENLGGEEAKIYSLVLENNPENRQGAEAHPSKAGHEDTKTKLVAFLKEKGLVD